ncbi:MAG: carboxypeptidase-like regulatory domain-containing protein, partial [Dehalococcoidia bacterium]
MNMKKKLHLSASLVLVALMAYLLFPHTAVAQEPVTVDGQVVNGSDCGDAPAGLEVTLHIFRPEGGVETLTTVTDSDGAFFFDQVPTGGSERYAVSATYQDVTSGVEPESLLGPTMLEIFDITENLSS